MFVCRGCLRSLTGLAATPLTPRLLASVRTTPALWSGRRTYRLKVDVDAGKLLANPDLGHNKSEVSPLEDDGQDQDHEQEDRRQGKEAYAKRLTYAVRKELTYLDDPWQLGAQVKKELEKGAFDKALMMTRMASRDMKVEVSWNLLIGYQLENKRLHGAVKLYNEMKKRGQIPNARTYTIFFRGCVESLHPRLAVAEATRIYNFMIKRGAVKPNTIHMNSVLEVCARAHDLDSLFTILSTANDNLRAPDSATYTVVFNALRHDCMKIESSRMGLIDAEIKREVQTNIQRARAIWANVLERWRAAKLVLDEQMVWSIARLLTLGGYHDNLDVLELLAQTENIPRFDQKTPQIPAVPSSGTTTENGAVTGTGTRTETTAENRIKTEENPADQSADQGDYAPDTKDWTPKERSDLLQSRQGKTPLYAKPGSRSLSVALTALGNVRKTSHAPKYWNYFTQVLGVEPIDKDYHIYLRTLSIGHASAAVASLIESMPPHVITPYTFRRALNTCISDNLSRDAFKNACRILDVMVARQRYPDPMALRLFLHAARNSTRHLERTPDGARQLGEQLRAAVDRIWEPFRILTGALSYPEDATASPEEELARKRGDMQEIMATARRAISAIDKVTNEQLLAHDAKALRELKARRVIMQRLVERWVVKLWPSGEVPKHGGETREGLGEGDKWEDVERASVQNRKMYLNQPRAGSS